MNKDVLWWFDGHWVPANQVSLAFDHPGLMWGAIVTDRTQIRDEKPFRLAAHIERLMQSAELAKIPLVADHESIKNLVEVGIQLNLGKAGKLWQVILLMLPKSSGAALSIQFLPQIVGSDQYKLFPYECTPMELSSVKHRSRLHWWVASQSVPAGFEPLFTSRLADPFIYETARANVLAIIDGVLVSPPERETLPGIARKLIFELAESLSIPTKFRPVLLSELITAEVVLITNSTFIMKKVSQIGAQPTSPGGPTWEKLENFWLEISAENGLWQDYFSDCPKFH
ncbi:MAG: aminotransferase class IV [Zavarzinella sp.]